MALGTKQKLVEMATGVKPPEPTPPVNTAMGKALVQKVQPTTYDDYLQAQGITAGVPITNVGLSPEGKYGGYYNKEDLNTAILGEAFGRKEAAAAYSDQIRQLATQRTQQGIDIAAAGLKPYQVEVGPYGVGFMSGPNVREMRDYARQQTQAMGQAVSAAENIEETPASAYARAIATSRYGMNPALAAGEFGPEVDAQAYEREREQLSLALTGKPYEAKRQEDADYRALISQLRSDKEYETKLEEQDMVSAVEAATGLSASRMRNLTGMSNQLLYQTVDSMAGSTIEQKTKALSESLQARVNGYYASDDKSGFLKDVYAKLRDPNQSGYYSMLLAMLLQRETQGGKTQAGLSAAALNQQMPMYSFDEG
jgi:hypothetical protein